MNARSPKLTKVQKLKDRFRVETSGVIMAAAEQVFAEHGFHDAHMGDIAARAGVSVGTLYNHFEDRESLLTGLLDAGHAELMARLDESMSVARDQAFEEQLRSLVAAAFAHFEAHWPFLKIIMQGEQGGVGSKFPKALPKSAATVAQVLARFDKVVSLGVKKKALRADDAELYSVLLLGLMRSLMMREARLGSSATPRFAGYVDRVVRFFLQGAGR